MNPPGSTRGDRFWQEVRTHWNFLRVVLPQFKVSISVFVTVVLFGGLVIWGESPELTFPQALYSALALIFFEVSEAYPFDGGLMIQAVYFLLPAVGLLVIAEAVLRFGVQIFNRKHLSREWHMALAETFSGHVVIAGMGRIGGRVAERLQSEEKLVCIEKQRPEGLHLSENVAVLVGDACLNEILEQANIEKARAILALTDDDLANLEIALNARELNPKIRVVLRMYNDKLGQRIVDQFGFQAVYSTSALAAPSFTAALYSNKILQTIQVREDKAVHVARVEVSAGSSLVGKSILEVETKNEVSVILHHSRDTDDLLPSVEQQVNAKDELYVLAELKDLDKFDRIALGEG